VGHDATVDDRDADSRADVPVLHGDIRPDGGFRILHGALDRVVRRDVLDIRVIGQFRQFGGGHAVRATFHHF
jgi:hypothetical protein